MRPLASKADFSVIYDAIDPAEYFSTLGELEYRKSDFVFDFFQSELIGPASALKILDLGCGFGINAIVAITQRPFGYFSEHASGPLGAILEAKSLMLNTPNHLQFYGVDGASRAVMFGIADGWLEGALVSEFGSLSDQDLLSFANESGPFDWIIGSGVIGYLGAAEFENILKLCATPRRTQVALWPLVGYDFSNFEYSLQRFGMTVVRGEALRRQRRYASVAEQAAFHAEASVNSSGREQDRNYNYLCVRQYTACWR